MSATLPTVEAVVPSSLANLEKGAHLVVWWALDLPPNTAEFVRETPANTAREMLGYEGDELFSIASILFTRTIQAANEANQKRPTQGFTALEREISSASVLFEDTAPKTLIVYSLQKALHAHIRSKADRRETLHLP